MENKEKIRNLLIDLKDNPRKLLELREYFASEVVEVAFENKLYESLMIAFQPISIDGEVIICLDAFSSDILNILKHSYDTNEQAEQEASQDEYAYNFKVVIPKEIKESFKKILLTINYEQISKMKIKNCHARQISGWNYRVETIKDVMIYSELPCLMASIDLFNKNIRTTMNDTECVFEDPPISSGICKIWFDYNSLSQENKDIVEELIASGSAERFMSNRTETISIFVPCSQEETVEEVSNRLRAIVSKLKAQDIKYGFGTMEEIYQGYAPTVERFPFYVDGLFINGLNLPDLIELGKLFGDNLYYDDEEGLVWRSPELYQRHKRYVESQSLRSLSQKL